MAGNSLEHRVSRTGRIWVTVVRLSRAKRDKTNVKSCGLPYTVEETSPEAWVFLIGVARNADCIYPLGLCNYLGRRVLCKAKRDATGRRCSTRGSFDRRVSFRELFAVAPHCNGRESKRPGDRNRLIVRVWSPERIRRKGASHGVFHLVAMRCTPGSR